jgi:hypothetical protein
MMTHGCLQGKLVSCPQFLITGSLGASSRAAMDRALPHTGRNWTNNGVSIERP